jgi:two-component system chemotaxis response regulator CheY
MLIDVHMPVMDGWELWAELQRDPVLRSIPAALLSADVRARAQATALGVTAYLTKPCPPEEICAIVAQFCRSPTAPA